MLVKQNILGLVIAVVLTLPMSGVVQAGKVAALGKSVTVTENGKTVTTRAVSCGGRSKRILRKPEGESAWCGVNVSSPCFSDVMLAARSACSSKLVANEPSAQDAVTDAVQAEVSAEEEQLAAQKLERRIAYDRELSDIDSRRLEIQAKLVEIEKQKKLLEQQGNTN